MGRIAKQKPIEVENVKPTKTKTKEKVSEEIAVCNKELVKVENKPKVKIGSNAYKHIPMEDILQKIQKAAGIRRCQRLLCVCYSIVSIFIKFVLPDLPLIAPPVITILSPGLRCRASFAARCA